MEPPDISKDQVKRFFDYLTELKKKEIYLSFEEKMEALNDILEWEESEDKAMEFDTFVERLKIRR